MNKYIIKKELNSFSQMENPVIYRIYKRWFIFMLATNTYTFSKDAAEDIIKSLS